MEGSGFESLKAIRCWKGQVVGEVTGETYPGHGSYLWAVCLEVNLYSSVPERRDSVRGRSSWGIILAIGAILSRPQKFASGCPGGGVGGNTVAFGNAGLLESDATNWMVSVRAHRDFCLDRALQATGSDSVPQSRSPRISI